MKIVFATDIYFPPIGGIEIVTKRLTQHLSQDGNEVYIIAPSPKTKDMVIQEGDVTVFGIASLPIPFHKNLRYCPYFLARKKVFRILSSVDPDVLHIETNVSIAESAADFARKFGKPVVATGHIVTDEFAFDFRTIKPLAKFVGSLVTKSYKKVWKDADILTSPSGSAVKFFYKNVQADRDIFPVSNGIDLTRFKHRGAIRTRRPVLLFVGRLDPIKQVETIIGAMPQILSKKDVDLILVGAGSERKRLENLVKSLGIEKNVRFTGFVSEREIVKFHRKASLFVIASVVETQGLAALEAAAAGLPIVASNVGALPELVKNGKNGYLFPLGDSGELARKVLTILFNRKLAIRMGKESLKIAKKHDIDGVVSQLQLLYQKAIAINMTKKVEARRTYFYPGWKLALKFLAIVILLAALFRNLFTSPSVVKAKSFRIRDEIKNSKIVKDIQDLDEKLWMHKQYLRQ